MERAENTHGLRDPNLVPIVLGIFPRWRARSAVVKWSKVAHPTNDGKGHQNQNERKFRSSERVLASWNLEFVELVGRLSTTLSVLCCPL